MLTGQELRHWVDRFGVAASQVERDHLVSHLLAALPDVRPEATFFGGTALCRTHLPHWRLSEDIDLLVDEPRAAALQLEADWPTAVQREFPGLVVHWQRQVTVGTARWNELTVRVQLVPLDPGYRRYPTSRLPVLLRYGDLPETVKLSCATADGAVAMKLNAWADRAGPRDLCDLYGLAVNGLVSANAVAIAAEASSIPQRHQFDEARLPTTAEWYTALAHQMAEPPDRNEALRTVRVAVGSLLGWPS